MYTSNCYMNLVSRARTVHKNIRTHELLVGRGHFSDDMVFNLFISSAVTKVGSFNLICKYQNYLTGAY